MKEGQRYRRKHDGLALLTRALRYRAKGLNQNEVARLLGIPKQRVSDLMARARKLEVTAWTPKLRTAGTAGMKTAFLSAVCTAISVLPPLDCAVDKKPGPAFTSGRSTWKTKRGN